MSVLPKHFPLLTKFLADFKAIPLKTESDLNTQLTKLISVNKKDDKFVQEFTDLIQLLMGKVNFTSAFTDYGIQAHRSFFQEIGSRLKHKLIPPRQENGELNTFLRLHFATEKDINRLCEINIFNWQLLLDLIQNDRVIIHKQTLLLQLNNAILILSHRLTAIGIDPYIVKRLPRADDFDSPFFELNDAVSLLARNHLQYDVEVTTMEIKSVETKLHNCEELLKELEDQKDKTGISLHLIFLTKMAFQQIERIRTLIALFLSKKYTDKVEIVSKLITELVVAERDRNSIRKFLSNNTQLLAYQVITHTSKKGEHYIGFTGTENKKLFISSMGGGLVVTFLVYLKHFIHHLHASLFLEGVLFGLTYATGFVLIHFTHLTLASKQPALTASYIAESLGDSNTSNKQSSNAFKQVIRSQLISLLGNVIVVLPLCFISAYVLKEYFFSPVFNYSEATKHFDDNHPLLSASLIYAFFTGILLSLSGTLTGVIDNKVVFSEIPYRIVNHPVLTKRFTEARLQKLARFAEKHTGAIIGNTLLGLVMGMADSIGTFLGFPIDVRHISISSGNYAISLGSTEFFPVNFLITVFFGVMLIGLVSVISTFLFSFILACRSRNLSWKQSLKVLFSYGKFRR
ncbi:MAG: hypothetical protein Q8M29_06520 [Bacteroidota bacterium]|nr:hypothetical protein [Bacteroidota bacterium]